MQKPKASLHYAATQGAPKEKPEGSRLKQWDLRFWQRGVPHTLTSTKKRRGRPSAKRCDRGGKATILSGLKEGIW